jgi:hypothetical protein
MDYSLTSASNSFCQSITNFLHGRFIEVSDKLFRDKHHRVSRFWPYLLLLPVFHFKSKFGQVGLAVTLKENYAQPRND